jgi:alkanesulfonate monooxygenase SsuD/methylene tetrahydromethanopterin reductase-like flavin-dependent oxidoreductase (luciferase family)
MALAIIGGSPSQFVPHVKLYRDQFQKSGHDLQTLQLGINSHVFLSDTSQGAADAFFPSYAEVMTRLGRERGWSAMTRDQFEAMRQRQGSLLVGSPDEVIDKILYEQELFKNTRFLAQMTVGVLAHEQVMHSIELFGTRVAPAIRKELAGKTTTPRSI